MSLSTTSMTRRGFLGAPLAAATPILGPAAYADGKLTEVSNDRNVHLLRRLTYGATTASLAELEAKGERAWLNEQLKPSTLDTSAVDAKVAQLPALGIVEPWDLLKAYPDGQAARDARVQLQVGSVLRQVHSPAQLYERMVEFWSDHFNVPVDGRFLDVMKIHDDRVVARTHAFGRFKDLLVASAQSPAMLDFLDNWLSSRGRINENYARELLELHTVGVTADYSEDDVVAIARLLTGWSMIRRAGAYVFRANAHDPERLPIMGWKRPRGNDYEAHGVDFLHWLAMHPDTATFVCTKIARRFASDTPDPAMVKVMADAWLANDSKIAPVLRAMIAHPGFEADAGEKFCRPLDYLAKVLRSLDADLAPTTERRELAELGRTLTALGQVPFGWPAPNGYPDVEGAWLNTGALINRWNMVGDVLAGQFSTIDFDDGPIVKKMQRKKPRQIYEIAAEEFLLAPISKAGRRQLRRQTGWDPKVKPTKSQIADELPTIAFVLLASPEGMYR